MINDILNHSKYNNNSIIESYLHNSSSFQTFDFEGELPEQLAVLKIRQETLLRLNKKIYGLDELVNNLTNSTETILITFCAEDNVTKKSFSVYYSPLTKQLFGILIFANEV